METSKAIKTRRSIRDFKSTPVEKDVLVDIIKAAQQAPFSGQLSTMARLFSYRRYLNRIQTAFSTAESS